MHVRVSSATHEPCRADRKGLGRRGRATYRDAGERLIGPVGGQNCHHGKAGRGHGGEGEAILCQALPSVLAARDAHALSCRGHSRLLVGRVAAPASHFVCPLYCLFIRPPPPALMGPCMRPLLAAFALPAAVACGACTIYCHSLMPRFRRLLCSAIQALLAVLGVCLFPGRLAQITSHTLSSDRPEAASG